LSSKSPRSDIVPGTEPGYRYPPPVGTSVPSPRPRLISSSL
jgi:hypothetical protein